MQESAKDAEKAYKWLSRVCNHPYRLESEENRVKKDLQDGKGVPSSTLLATCPARTFQSTFHLLGSPSPLDAYTQPSSIGKGWCLEESTRLHFTPTDLATFFKILNFRPLLASSPPLTLHHLLLQPLTLVHLSANIVLRSSATFVTSTRSFQKLSLTLQVRSTGKSQKFPTPTQSFSSINPSIF